MTIAVCYLSPEGLVLGADSTSSAMDPRNGFHYFNHNQKVFEVGEGGTLGLVTWGLGSLGSLSHRTLIAQLSDDFLSNPPKTVDEAATRWAQLFFNAYQDFLTREGLLATLTQLDSKREFVPGAALSADMRTPDEEELFQHLNLNLVVGFVIGGYCLPGREPKAFTVVFEPLRTSPPSPLQVATDSVCSFGVPNMTMRLIRGYDHNLRAGILRSGRWSGTEQELDRVLAHNNLSHANLPIRDAIDYVHTCISSTIKAMKFSWMPQVCGGPIELAVITTDRRFRWVRHKPWDAAINEGAQCDATN